MNVLVVGSTGLVGTNVSARALEDGHELTGTYHTGRDTACEHADYRLAKEDGDSVVELVTELEPDAVVDTAAFHDVDACERDRDRSWTVNAGGTRNVAVAADAVDAHYVFVSTDYVFPGVPDEAPYREADAVSPVSYYAETKYAGEQAAKIASTWTVLRTSVVYGLARPNFVTWVLSELREGNGVDVVDDQTSTPTYAPDLARACVEVVEDDVTGLYHATGPKSLSRYEFTRDLAEVRGYDPDLVDPISTEELGQTAPRPTDGSLDSTTLYEELGWAFGTPKESFRTMAETD